MVEPVRPKEDGRVFTGLLAVVAADTGPIPGGRSKQGV